MRRRAIAGFAALIGTFLPAIAVGPLGAAQSAAVVASGTHPAVAYFAHLRLRLETDSDWASVQISPGTVYASRLLAKTGPGHWQVQANGIRFAGPDRGWKQATVDFLYTDFNKRSPVRLQVAKGDIGTARVTAWRVAGSKPVLIGELHDAYHATAGRTSFTKTLTLPRATAMNARAAQLPAADPRRLVLAFYYPWYRDYRAPQLADRPRRAWSTDTTRGVRALTRQAKHAGVDGFVVSWHGADADGRNFRRALAAAHRYHQIVTGYLETPTAVSSESPAQRLLAPEYQTLAWFVQLLRYSRNHAFLRSHGVPVVFVYRMDVLSPGGWRSVLDQLRYRYHRRVHLVGDTADPAYLRYEWGLHRYAAVEPRRQLTPTAVDASLLAKAAAVLDGARPRLYAATVMPGLDDRRVPGRHDPVIRRQGGARYRQTWRAALAARADWVLVTSWNEWYEDTEIEPGRHTGSRALQITRRLADSWAEASQTG